ncbi:MAG: cupin domain-containing protein [Candidatus Bathyarchaeia archaeon]
MKSYMDVPEEAVDLGGVENVRLRWLIGDDMGINFAVRRYEVGGRIPVHVHPHEHGIYILSGSGRVLGRDGPRELRPNHFLFIPPNEPHGFENVREEPLVILCIVPVKRGATKILELENLKVPIYHYLQASFERRSYLIED